MSTLTKVRKAFQVVKDSHYDSQAWEDAVSIVEAFFDQESRSGCVTPEGSWLCRVVKCGVKYRIALREADGEEEFVLNPVVYGEYTSKELATTAMLVFADTHTPYRWIPKELSGMPSTAEQT